MPDPRHAAAADLLLRHWDAGTRLVQLPPELRPATRAEGYAIQAQWMRHTRKPLFGWKIAATSEVGADVAGKSRHEGKGANVGEMSVAFA